MPAPNDKAPRKRDWFAGAVFHDATIIPGVYANGSTKGYALYRKSLERSGDPSCLPGLGGKCVLCGTGDCNSQSGHE